jgi:hypothetical protein
MPPARRPELYCVLCRPTARSSGLTSRSNKFKPFPIMFCQSLDSVLYFISRGRLARAQVPDMRFRVWGVRAFAVRDRIRETGAPTSFGRPASTLFLRPQHPLTIAREISSGTLTRLIAQTKVAHRSPAWQKKPAICRGNPHNRQRDRLPQAADDLEYLRRAVMNESRPGGPSRAKPRGRIGFDRAS